MTLALYPSEKKLANHLKSTKIQWFRHQLQVWATQHLRDFPWRRTTNPYAIFVAEFLLQKTGASTAHPVYETFINRYPTLKKLAPAPVEEVANVLQPLGLHFRAKRLCESARVIVKNYNGKIPDTEAELLALPGIGKYTARSICANAFSMPLAILDTNVARILERFFGLSGGRVKSRCKLLWQAAEEVAPPTNVGIWNLTLLDFGAIVCTAKKPRCTECSLRFQCSYIISVNANG